MDHDTETKKERFARLFESIAEAINAVLEKNKVKVIETCELLTAIRLHILMDIAEKDPAGAAGIYNNLAQMDELLLGNVSTYVKANIFNKERVKA